MNVSKATMAAVVALVGIAIAVAAWIASVRTNGNDSGIITLQGNVDVRQVNLSFKVAGRVAEMKVDEGDRVELGTAVASLDKSYFADEVRLARARAAAQSSIVARLVDGTRPEEIAQARAIVAERDAGVVLAQATLGRQEELVRIPVIADTDSV